VSTDARTAELRREDARARREAQREFDRPFALEAGAGTGKTAALVARVLAWTLGKGWERAAAGGEALAHRVAARVLSGVVAITFTEAAAAEMATRIDKALREIESGTIPLGVCAECLPAEAIRRERARALRGALDHLEVHTIHAWCRRLLAMHPLEARLHPRLEIDPEGRRQAEAAREVLETRLGEVYGEPGDPDFLALADEDVGPLEIEKALLELLHEGVPAEALESDPLAPDRIVRLRERLVRALEAVRDVLGDCLEGCGTPVAVATLDRVHRTLARLEQEPLASRGELEAFLAWRESQWQENEVERLRQWAKGKFGSREGGAIGDRAGALAEPAAALAGRLRHLAALDPERLDRARRVLGPLLAEVEAQLRARGVLGFSDLLTETARLLTACPDAAARVRSRVDQLLIDEFQDTDRRQCEIVRAVALEGPRAERPGLFLVGDPKQSIYGWRSADLAAYTAFLGDVETAGGVCRRLSVNYRSVPAVLDEVERIAGPNLVPEEGVQPPFEALVPSEANAGSGGFAAGRFAPVEFWLPDAVDRDAGARIRARVGEAAEIEAAALARDLRALHDEHGVAWKEVGVLFRSRGDWEVYLGALREAGVPYAVVGDRSYYQRREIIDAAALVRSVLDPNDQLALVAFVRSAAVGVPDAALLPLWRRGFPSLMTNLEALAAEKRVELEAAVRDAAESLPADVPGRERVTGWEQNLLAAIEALAALRASARSEAPDVFVERLRTALLFEASEAARFLGVWRAANLERFFRELTRDLCEGADRHEVLRRLRGAVLDAEAAEEATPREIVDDAVQVLTIHGAKGLDFEHVYLMQLHKGSGRGGGGPSAAEVEGAFEYVLFEAPTPGFDAVQRERARVAEAEIVRTLYVAMTRAKSRLVLSGSWPEEGKDGGGSHAALLRARSLPPPDLDAGFARLVERGEGDGFDAAGARWVFPALAGAEAPRSAASEAGDGALPSLERVEADARRLREVRESAAALRARRFGAPASGDHTGAWTEQRADHQAGEAEPAASAAEVARAVGTAVHGALEALDLATDADAEVARLREVLADALRSLVDPERFDAALDEAADLLDAVVAGPLFARLRDLAGRVVARELPVLAPPETERGPVGFVSGAIDLLYRDPESDELVVADYKTDRVPSGTALAEHGRRYAGQGAVYCRAVRNAFDLPYTPRFELWYLQREEILPVALPASGGTD
jgi:ATP-dependent helicase/nuclease subunit A